MRDGGVENKNDMNLKLINSRESKDGVHRDGKAPKR